MSSLDGRYTIIRRRVLRFCQLFGGCLICIDFHDCPQSEVLSTLRWLTHLHRLSGLPSVWGSCTIASLADATAANLTALAWHSPGQLDQLQVRVLRLVKATIYPASAQSAIFGPEPTSRLWTGLHRLMTTNTACRRTISEIGE